MSKKPMDNLSVIVPLHGFAHDREQALDILVETVKAQDLADFEIIVVEQMDGDSRHSFLNLTPPYINHITLPAQSRGFNKSWCMNVAAKKAKFGRLVFLDVDMMFGKNYFSTILQYAQSNEPKFLLCWTYITFMPGKDEPIPRQVDRNILTAGGAFYIPHDFFWSIGGMNENYFGYGGEDNDLWLRANRKMGESAHDNISILPYALVHKYHDWAEPSPSRFHPLNRTLHFPEIIEGRLLEVKLGNPSGPTEIEIGDLNLTEPGLEEGGRGLL